MTESGLRSGGTRQDPLRRWAALRPLTVRTLIDRLLRRNVGRLLSAEDAIRQEGLGPAARHDHLRNLALMQQAGTGFGRLAPLRRRIRETGAALLSAYRVTQAALRDGQPATPAAEWLLDNFHVVETQIRSVGLELEFGGYQRLPAFTTGSFAGYARILGLSWTYVALSDSHFDVELLVSDLQAFQDITPLTIGEIWALPTILRYALLENLRRVAGQVELNRAARARADHVADLMLKEDLDGPKSEERVAQVKALLKEAVGERSGAFIVQLLHRVRDQDCEPFDIEGCIKACLAALGMTAHDTVVAVHLHQGESNLTVRNIIKSLRQIDEMDWTATFERISRVDAILGAGSSFADMDSMTRGLYRRAVEQIARRSGRSESAIANLAIQTALRTAGPVRPADHATEPGYHLIGAGRRSFEATAGIRHFTVFGAWRDGRNLGLWAYGAANLAMIVLILAAALALMAAEDMSAGWLLILGLLAAIPVSDAAVVVVHRAMVRVINPILLPGMELRDGIPEEYRTLVVVPALLTSPAGVSELIDALEIHHLASRDGDLLFALLSDWTDCDHETAAADNSLLSLAEDGIAELNRRYGPAAAGVRFHLFHRRRTWSDSEQCWIGWERKRGKLRELNRLLRGSTDTGFLPRPGMTVPVGVRYVITLDSDTRLPRETVRHLVGKMAHPLNRAIFDPAQGRVTAGYGILQPLVVPSLPVGREGSLFQQIFSSVSGLDPYAGATSDLYQDLFGEGSYAGKGIYEVDSFEAALGDRVADSTQLSHDLFEGVFARSGLVTDVNVVESFPADYMDAARRHHRWVRGDWQLLPRILGKEAMPQTGRWKMVDNLRRSLIPPFAFLSLLAGWMTPGLSALGWTAFILTMTLTAPLLPIASAVLSWRRGVVFASHLRALGREFRLALCLAGLIVTFLGHQAWLMSDAILRTVWRLTVSRRHLLQWVPSSGCNAADRQQSTVRLSFQRMAGTEIVTVAGLVAVSLLAPWNLPLALPFIAVWAASPWIARRISGPPTPDPSSCLSPGNTDRLRRIGRRTWRYFETFVTPADNFLPPDNFQEDPQGVVAHRTSPTNIGTYLLSVAVARQMGWIGTGQAVARLEATFSTLGRMVRVRGHFLNWYDSSDLRPLDPHYISSVDSGNLAGHLIALASACRNWITAPPDPGENLSGIMDTITLALESFPASDLLTQSPDISRHEIRRTLAKLQEEVRTAAGALDRAAALPAGPESVSFQRLEQLAELLGSLLPGPEARPGTPGNNVLVRDQEDYIFWCRAVVAVIQSHQSDRTADDRARLESLARQAHAMAMAMDFTFLLDPQRQLLSIGFRIDAAMLDPNCYDLLASEARLASFVAIAKNDLPSRHWSRLGRSMTAVADGAALISWSGSMFEYLMPSLVMRAPAGSLLDETSRRVVQRQVAYGGSLGLPWGISESGFNSRDLEFTYQYSSFGVPGLGLKQGLSENRVIAPYATALAAMVDPTAALQNFEHLHRIGSLGRYGFYEALDFTPERCPPDQKLSIVRSFMAHHQGMTVLAIGNVVQNGLLRRWFHADPLIQATELLLQERMARDVLAAVVWNADAPAHNASSVESLSDRLYNTPHLTHPATVLLSNGSMLTMVTSAGSGFCHRGGMAITRWREDPTCDAFGSYFLLRDMEDGRIWSAGYQPCGVEPEEYTVGLTEDRASFTRHDARIVTRLDVVISAESDAELRNLSIRNSGRRPRQIEITSYTELVLAPQAADVAHPAFMKLFVETEFDPISGAVLATRRRRAPAEPELWAAQICVVDGVVEGPVSHETDRRRFIGRGRTIRTAVAMDESGPLSGTVGTVLDAVFARRVRIVLQPGETARLAYWLMLADDRPGVMAAVERHLDPAAVPRALTLAWTQAHVHLQHLQITAGEAGLYQRLAGYLIHASPAARPTSVILRAGAGLQSDLWSLGVSGDLPIVLLRIADTENLDVARSVVRAHAYWQSKRFQADLIILNEHCASYARELQDALDRLLRSPGTGEAAGPGKVVLLRSELLAPELLNRLSAVARVVLVAQRGSLYEQLAQFDVARTLPGRSTGTTPPPPARNPPGTATPTEPDRLEFFNGTGGFGDNGRSYVTILGPAADSLTPTPWINVIANSSFGFQVSAEGSGFSWSVNSRDYRLTPWSNDPVSDPTGEAFYLRDQETGDLWCSTAAPIRVPGGVYTATHGFGFSRFDHASYGIASELTQFAALGASVKVSRLALYNQTRRLRTLSVTAYVEWVLGSTRSVTRPFVITEIDPVTGVMFAVNPWNVEFPGRVAFLDLRRQQSDWTGDRREFIGRHGTLNRPAALGMDSALSNRVGAGLDPCGALRCRLDILPGGSVEVVALLGDAASIEEARSLVLRYRGVYLDKLQSEVVDHWQGILGDLQVTTPDRVLDIMLNGWALYQTIACRVLARTAFSQASGAFGFRDQLQDGMALASRQPAMTRAHLIRAAGRQFREGDVQHWWLPHSGQGVRTRIADVTVWLAVAVSHYVDVTGDSGILDQQIGFLSSPPLLPGEAERYSKPEASTDPTADLYTHCALALDDAFRLGPHGLPLFRNGDWNDGMNRVGEQGVGESTWLAWHLATALTVFARIAERRDDTGRAALCRERAATVVSSIEASAWDGQWYRRGTFDDGSPLGADGNAECRIDSIAQSAAVLSGLADPVRAETAMASVRRELIRADDGLALLFTPPFSVGIPDPGYIRGYPPGIRENGGQYTHAAMWTVMALAALKQGDNAGALLSMLNPIRHALTADAVQRYRCEPYAVAADIYSCAPHVGQGGWTWYTGSSGLMQRAGIESILGLRRAGGFLQMDPCIPKEWDGFQVTLRLGPTRYEISVTNPSHVQHGVRKAELDGQSLPGESVRIRLLDDGGLHHLNIELGSDRQA
jgi:cyclic beta-1,2-glucan synthetase